MGGGLTGLVTALRLTENGTYSVGLVEAGGFYEIDGGNQSVIPAYESNYLEGPPTIDWKIYTTNQAVRVYFPRSRYLSSPQILTKSSIDYSNLTGARYCIRRARPLVEGTHPRPRPVPSMHDRC